MIITLERVKLIGRIAVLVVVGALLIFSANKAFSLYRDFYNANEEIALLAQDLVLAKSFGKSANKKLADINKQYAQLLKAYDSKVTAYAELYAKYEATAKALKEIQSSIPNNTSTSVPCPESGQCTREVCWPLFVGEKLEYEHSDHCISLKLKLTRLDQTSWETVMSYHIHPSLKLTLLEVTNSKTGRKDLQAKLVEIDDQGNELQPLKISKFEYVSEDNSKFGMSWWAPTLKLGIHQPLFTQNSWYPRAFLAVSLSKWGRPGHIDLWHFFQIGAGIGANSPVFFIATPVSYNLGNFLPLVSDVWIGIDVSLDIKAQCTVGVSISTSL